MLYYWKKARGGDYLSLSLFETHNYFVLLFYNVLRQLHDIHLPPVSQQLFYAILSVCINVVYHNGEIHLQILLILFPGGDLVE